MLHDWVARLLRSEGADRRNQLRGRAEQVAAELGAAEEFKELDAIFGAALGTRPVETRSAALASAQQGRAYDDRRLAAFTALANHLEAPGTRTVREEDRVRLTTLPFFEAYFSNFIEGTEFTVEEAAEIVLHHAIPEARPEDAHDVLGTSAVVADHSEMMQRPGKVDEFVDLLRRRHARILDARP